MTSSDAKAAKRHLTEWSRHTLYVHQIFLLQIRLITALSHSEIPDC